MNQMKTYRVTVNGIAYDVEVEELGSAAAAPSAPAAPAPAPAPKAAPAPAAQKAAPAGHGGAGAIKAPMPGTIIKVNVKPGAAIKKGDVLCVLEAMKMENDIMAPADGTVATVEVSAGQSVQTDAVLVTFN